MPDHLSLAAARRVALVAQGFADPSPTGPVDRRHLRRVLARTRLFQVDSVNVYERAHYLPAFSRLGPYRTGLLDEMAFTHRELFEYWGHEACLLPVALHPLLRWRMARAQALEEGWGSTVRVVREQPALVARVLAMVRERGPVGAGALREGPRGPAAWWGWDPTKAALEHLFWTGQVTTSSRRSFERLYDLTERVLPAAVLDLPTPGRQEAQRGLLRLAAAALGVATEGDLRDYFRLRADEAAPALRDLVEAGEVVPVAVEGWRQQGYLWPSGGRRGAVVGERVISPFDPLVFRRERALRLFSFDYRLEIYTPAARRRHGYYVLPFLHGEDLAARVDLKADRRTGVLRVLSAWLEPGRDAVDTAEALGRALVSAAHWRGLSAVTVDRRGDLAPVLAPLLGQGEGW